MHSIALVYGQPCQKEMVPVPDGCRWRAFGGPPIESLTVEELRANLLRSESEAYRLNELLSKFTQLVDADTPWPDGIGYWDGITRRQTEEEHARRIEARV